MAYALKVAKKVLGIDLTLNVIHDVKEAKFQYGTVDVLDMGLVPADAIPDTSDLDEPKPFKIGACALGGEAAYQYVVKVIRLAMDGEVDATINPFFHLLTSVLNCILLNRLDAGENFYHSFIGNAVRQFQRIDIGIVCPEQSIGFTVPYELNKVFADHST